MKWKFHYLGDQQNEQYFCIITDDGKGNGQGISTCYHYYIRREDGSLKTLNYLQIPQFEEQPKRHEAALLMDRVTRFFHGWIPYRMDIVNYK